MAKLPGAINRVPQAGETRSNLHVGGTAVKVELTNRDREICERLKPELKRRGLIFTGIDVIGPYLTEINVTSPTGIRQVKAFGGNDIAAMIWDAIEAKVRTARSNKMKCRIVRKSQVTLNVSGAVGLCWSLADSLSVLFLADAPAT